jgi:hypothetical protein
MHCQRYFYFRNYKENSYAAVAPKVSKGFATVAQVTMQRNNTINPVIQAKLDILLFVNSKIQSGAMSITSPIQE